MNYLQPFFLNLALCGPIFLLVGYFVKRKPPKEINHLYGYRTANSMISQERWDFAQTYSARQMIKIGLYMCLLSIPALFLNLQIWVSLALSVVSIIFFAWLIFYNTEKAINQKFGTRHK